MEDNNEKDVEQVLSDEILADARRRADRVVKRAEREAKKATDRVVKDAEDVRARMLSVVDGRIAQQRHVFESGIALEERMRRLKVQGRLIDEVLEEGLDRLTRRDGLDYEKVLRNLAVEAAIGMKADKLVMKLGKEDWKSMKDMLPGAVASIVKEKTGCEVTIVPDEVSPSIEAGVVMTVEDGSEEFDNSFAGRMRRMKDELRFEVAELIFQATDDDAKKDTARGDASRSPLPPGEG